MLRFLDPNHSLVMLMKRCFQPQSTKSLTSRFLMTYDFCFFFSWKAHGHHHLRTMIYQLWLMSFILCHYSFVALFSSLHIQGTTALHPQKCKGSISLFSYASIPRKHHILLCKLSFAYTCPIVSESSMQTNAYAYTLCNSKPSNYRQVPNYFVGM
jgi:hypothetical protein